MTEQPRAKEAPLPSMPRHLPQQQPAKRPEEGQAVTIPRDALACVDARIRALRPGECARVEVVLDAVRDKGGRVWHVVARVRERRDEGERFEVTLREGK